MTPTRARDIVADVVGAPIAVWIGFVLVHLWLGLLCLYGPNQSLGDVTRVYAGWMDLAFDSQYLVGIDTVWVYPVVALVPMALARILGPEFYGSTWLTMVMLLNAVALGFLTGWGRTRERFAIGWWWVGFLLLLGPIALGRIDSVTVPLAIVGVVLIGSRPRAAAAVLTVAMWIKVWPAALVAAALVALRARWRILGVVLGASAAIIVIALALGSGTNVLSFVGQQAGRGLQVEAPVATLWLWQAFAGVGGSYVYFDTGILTFQVQGDGVMVASALMTPLLAVAVGLVAVLGIRAVRAGALPGDLLPPLSLALVVVLIAVNKVGSPQFIGWIAVPVILGLAASAAGHGRSFRVPAALALAIAALTQAIYPFLYNWLLALDPRVIALLTLRNVLEFVLLGWAVRAIVAAPRYHDDEDDPTDAPWLPVWLDEPAPASPPADRES